MSQIDGGMERVDRFNKLLQVANEQHTRCSKAWVVGGDIIYVESRKSAEIELEDAKEDMQLSEELMKEASRFGTIVNMANIKSISKGARDWYSQVQNDNPCNISVALVVDSFYSRIIANFFLGFKNSRTIMKIFNEKDIAIEWLYEQLEINKRVGG
jgi:hypothetical protein|tara:strand:+ start:232 stop:699 length:468 start_codon:yes stop_codon:yes gene_type:complete